MCRVQVSEWGLCESCHTALCPYGIAVEFYSNAALSSDRGSTLYFETQECVKLLLA